MVLFVDFLVNKFLKQESNMLICFILKTFHPSIIFPKIYLMQLPFPLEYLYADPERKVLSSGAHLLGFMSLLDAFLEHAGELRLNLLDVDILYATSYMVP